MNNNLSKKGRIRIESKPLILFLFFSISVEGGRGTKREHVVGKGSDYSVHSTPGLTLISPFPETQVDIHSLLELTLLESKALIGESHRKELQPTALRWFPARSVLGVEERWSWPVGLAHQVAV